ncbi:MAG: hypothetical protein U0105_26055 [Candidatus Obscuribacterales bacterium]
MVLSALAVLFVLGANCGCTDLLGVIGKDSRIKGGLLAGKDYYKDEEHKKAAEEFNAHSNLTRITLNSDLAR